MAELLHSPVFQKTLSTMLETSLRSILPHLPSGKPRPTYPPYRTPTTSTFSPSPSYSHPNNADDYSDNNQNSFEIYDDFFAESSSSPTTSSPLASQAKAPSVSQPSFSPLSSPSPPPPPPHSSQTSETLPKPASQPGKFLLLTSDLHFFVLCFF